MRRRHSAPGVQAPSNGRPPLSPRRKRGRDLPGVVSITAFLARKVYTKKEKSLTLNMRKVIWGIKSCFFFFFLYVERSIYL